MRRIVSIAVAALAVAGVFAARSGMRQPAPEEGGKKLIDLKSDLMGPVAPGDSVVFLVGNFAAQHNGAVITCDSAVRYSDMRIEFFGNVKAADVLAACREKGLLVLTAKTRLRLLPPLTLTAHDVEMALTILNEVLSEMAQKSPEEQA